MIVRQERQNSFPFNYLSIIIQSPENSQIRSRRAQDITNHSLNIIDIARISNELRSRGTTVDKLLGAGPTLIFWFPCFYCLTYLKAQAAKREH